MKAFKYIFSSIFFLVVANLVVLQSAFAQIPQTISYQAVIRNNSDQLVVNITIGIQLSLLQGSTSGTVVYAEYQTPSTNENGLISIEFGGGPGFSTIDWSNGPYFLQTEIDPAGGTNYSVMGTSQLLSVPYALHANSAENLTGTINETDPVFSNWDKSTGISITESQIQDLQNYMLEENLDIENILNIGNNANYHSVDNLIIGQCSVCDSSKIGCIRYNIQEKKLQICNGEEFVDIITGATDLPADGVFTSPLGADNVGCGTKNNPCRTISYSMNVAVAENRSTILVANGLYYETVVLANGINLLGGFNPTTWQRNISTGITMISGTDKLNNHPVTVIAQNINQPTLLEGFVIVGKDADVNGTNSYAIYINNSNSNLEIKENSIQCGKGATGSNGNAGSHGINGTNGSLGPWGVESPTTGCDSSIDRQLENGGYCNANGNDISGGRGGGNFCTPVGGTITSGRSGSNGYSGAGILGGVGGNGGSSGYDWVFDGTNCYTFGNDNNGQNGIKGGNGINGYSGSGGLANTYSIISGHFVGPNGSEGQEGGNGGGGGGGGASGGYDCNTSPCYFRDYLGSHGGGGGSGGGGGLKGSGGNSGGSSFGIFILNCQAPVLLNNVFTLGNGGNGGTGGAGGIGGQEGLGANGGLSPHFCIGTAGKGGDGGRGGHGGAGGGGAGGSVFGVFTYNTTGSMNYATQNTFSGGTVGIGGAGGFSYAGDGGNGQSGQLINCSYN
jgi:hypothetical protein